MTNQEAISYFKFNRKIFCEDHLKICPKDSIAYQATLLEQSFYDMAISALQEQEAKHLTESSLTQKELDTISRQDTIDAIGILLEQSENDEHDKIWNNAIRGSINVVKHHLPSAQPQSDTIRCKDCKYRGEKPISDGLYRCEINNSFMYCRKEN